MNGEWGTLPRFPTIQEEQERAESLLSELLAEVFPEANGNEFFEKLERHSKAKLNVEQRIHITRLVVTCRIRGRQALEVTDLKKANQLVKSTRREIELLHRRVEKAEGDIGRGNSRSTVASVGRECWWIYQDAAQNLEQLSVLTCGARERLAEVELVVFEALHLASPPFRYSDFDGALALLNKLLNDWSAATQSKKARSGGAGSSMRPSCALLGCTKTLKGDPQRPRMASSRLPMQFCHVCRLNFTRNPTTIHSPHSQPA